MIYLIGDTDEDFRRFEKQSFLQQMDICRDDYVIVCGDFDGLWDES